MVYEILEYYKKNISLRVMIWGKISWEKKYVFIGSILLLAIFSINFLVYFYVNVIVGIFLSIISLFSILFIMLQVLNKLYKDVLKNVYQIESPKRFWNRQKFHILQLRRLERYLEVEGLNKKEKIKYLIELFEDTVTEERKPVLIVNTSIVLTVFTPVWIQLLTWMFREEVGDTNQAILVSAVLFICIYLIFFLYSAIKSVVVDDFIYAEHNRMKTVIRMLKNIYLKKI